MNAQPNNILSAFIPIDIVVSVPFFGECVATAFWAHNKRVESPHSGTRIVIARIVAGNASDIQSTFGRDVGATETNGGDKAGLSKWMNASAQQIIKKKTAGR